MNSTEPTTDLSNIYPLIVPQDYYVKNVWELPHYVFPDNNFILTWVSFGEGTMEYLRESNYQILNANYPGWEQIAFENLRHLDTAKGIFSTHTKMSQDGKRIIFKAFINEDGIGSSRILLSKELTSAFPNGYYVAFPDRSCGLIIPKNISREELEEMKALVKKMKKGATISMSNQLHDMADFAVPEAWIMPIDENHSQSLVEKLTTN